MKMFHCLTCVEPCDSGEMFCKICQFSLRWSMQTRHPEPLGPMKLFSMGIYEGAFARLVKIMKAQPFNVMPSDLRSLLQSWVTHWTSELKDGFDGIVAVPSHPIRSFFQTDLSGLLGQYLSVTLAVPFYGRLLGYRENPFRGPRPQKGLQRKERVKNAWTKNVFIEAEELGILQKSRSRTPRVLLVDDVCATGMTLRSCRRHLEVVGLKVRSALVIARAPLAGEAVLG